MTTRSQQLPAGPALTLDYKPLVQQHPLSVDTSSTQMYAADSATGNDDVRAMHKYYWDQQTTTGGQQCDAESSAPEASSPEDAADVAVSQHPRGREQQQQQQQVPAPEVELLLQRRDNTYPTGAGSKAGAPPLVPPPPPLIPYGLPAAVCGGGGGDSKLLTTVSDYPYETSGVRAPVAGYLATHAGADYAGYAGYSPAGGTGTAHDVSMAVAGSAAYHRQAAAGYPCQQRMTSSNAPQQFAAADIKTHHSAAILPPCHGNSTAELYQWVREQQNYAAANAIGINVYEITEYDIV